MLVIYRIGEKLTADITLVVPVKKSAIENRHHDKEFNTVRKVLKADTH